MGDIFEKVFMLDTWENLWFFYQRKRMLSAFNCIVSAHEMNVLSVYLHCIITGICPKLRMATRVWA